MPSNLTQSPWTAAAIEKPDADIMVLAYHVPSESWYLVSWDGYWWLDVETQQPRRVSHWMHLPEGPQ